VIILAAQPQGVDIGSIEPDGLAIRRDGFLALAGLVGFLAALHRSLRLLFVWLYVVGGRAGKCARHR